MLAFYKNKAYTHKLFANQTIYELKIHVHDFSK